MREVLHYGGAQKTTEGIVFVLVNFSFVEKTFFQSFKWCCALFYVMTVDPTEPLTYLLPA